MFKNFFKHIAEPLQVIQANLFIPQTGENKRVRLLVELPMSEELFAEQSQQRLDVVLRYWQEKISVGKIVGLEFMRDVK